MLEQPELFPSVNQIPPTGLTTQKEQAIDPLEGLRRKEEVKEEARELFSEGQDRGNYTDTQDRKNYMEGGEKCRL